MAGYWRQWPDNNHTGAAWLQYWHSVFTVTIQCSVLCRLHILTLFHSYAQLAHTVAGELCLTDVLELSEYSYYNPNILSTWAGPQHWKLRPRNRDPTITTGLCVRVLCVCVCVSITILLVMCLCRTRWIRERWENQEKEETDQATISCDHGYCTWYTAVQKRTSEYTSY